MHYSEAAAECDCFVTLEACSRPVKFPAALVQQR